MSLLSDTYKARILKTKRGHNNGVYSNAKPILILAIIEAIDEGFLLGNCISFSNNELQKLYATINSRNYANEGIYRAHVKKTPFNLPYFHLNAEDFYHIKWKPGVIPPRQAESPSGKFLTENVDYAYLDDTLWELLQDKSVREEYKDAIITHFLKTE